MNHHPIYYLFTTVHGEFNTCAIVFDSYQGRRHVTPTLVLARLGRWSYGPGQSETNSEWDLAGLALGLVRKGSRATGSDHRILRDEV